jgi:hypothetical protein
MALAHRRTQRDRWAYILWLPAYGIAMLLLGINSEPEPGIWFLILYIPLVAAGIQWFWPTILGWLFVFIPTFLYTGQLLYFTIKYEGAEPDTWGTALNWIFFVFLVIVCGGLMIARPKISERVQPPADVCKTCGYDLRATPSRCPECGTIPTRSGGDPRQSAWW